MDTDTDLDTDFETDVEVNAQPVFIPLTPKEKIIRSLEADYRAAYEAAVLAEAWKDITKHQVPSAALELFCISASSELKEEAARLMLKKVKRHLIHLNLTVLDAYERRMLADAIKHVQYQEAHFVPRVSREVPDSSEAEWVAKNQPIVVAPEPVIEVSKGRGRKPLSNEIIIKIRFLRAGGMSFADVSKEVGRSIPTCMKYA